MRRTVKRPEVPGEAVGLLDPNRSSRGKSWIGNQFAMAARTGGWCPARTAKGKDQSIFTEI